MAKVFAIGTGERLAGEASDELEALSYAEGNHTGAVAAYEQGGVWRPLDKKRPKAVSVWVER